MYTTKQKHTTFLQYILKYWKFVTQPQPLHTHFTYLPVSRVLRGPRLFLTLGTCFSAQSTLLWFRMIRSCLRSDLRLRLRPLWDSWAKWKQLLSGITSPKFLRWWEAAKSSAEMAPSSEDRHTAQSCGLLAATEASRPKDTIRKVVEVMIWNKVLGDGIVSMSRCSQIIERQVYYYGREEEGNVVSSSRQLFLIVRTRMCTCILDFSSFWLSHFFTFSVSQFSLFSLLDTFFSFSANWQEWTGI